MLDVQAVFHNTDVEEEVFVKMPPRLQAQQRVRSSTRHGAQEKPLRSPEEPEELVSTMDHHLGKIGSSFLKSDPCVYVCEDENGSAILTLNVDDVLLLGANKQLLDKLNIKLMDHSEMTDMGDVSRVFGMNINRDRKEGTITTNQKDYTEGIVQHFGCGAATPCTLQEWDLSCPQIN